MHARSLRGDARSKPRRFAGVTCLVIPIMAIAQAGCGLWQENVTAQYRDRAEQVEPLLEQAGFLRMPAETAAQRSEMNSLKPLALSRALDKKKGAVYWFADPYVCGCMYAGNEAAHLRYRELLRNRQVANQMKASRVLNTEAWDQVGEAPEINMFNPVFSP